MVFDFRANHSYNGSKTSQHGGSVQLDYAVGFASLITYTNCALTQLGQGMGRYIPKGSGCSTFCFLCSKADSDSLIIRQFVSPCRAHAVIVE